MLPKLHVRWKIADPLLVCSQHSLSQQVGRVRLMGQLTGWDVRPSKQEFPKVFSIILKCAIITKVHFLEQKLWSWQVSPYRTIGKCRHFGGNSCFQLQGWKSLLISCQTIWCHVPWDYNLTVTAMRALIPTEALLLLWWEKGCLTQRPVRRRIMAAICCCRS